jgi:hypothetical protein
VQFQGNFLELLGFADDFRPLSLDDPAFPFAGFLQNHLVHDRHGVAMAVFRSTNAEEDAELFARDGIGQGRLLPFSRFAKGPDGSDKTVAFTVAFANAAAMPHIGFFTCQQHRPENFWNPAVQVHDNGTLTVAGIVIVSEDPSVPLDFLRHFTGERTVREIPGGLALVADNSRIEVITSPAFRLRYGRSGSAEAGDPRIAAILLSVASLEQTRGYLTAQHVPWRQAGDRIIVDPVQEAGYSLVFGQG